MTLEVVTKNEFFTYFSGVGKGDKHREHTQIWNSGGYAIKIQGLDWKGGYNGFAKRHLIATAGGKSAGAADPASAKMMRLQDKRARNLGQSRQVRFKSMVDVFQPRPPDMKDKAVREKYASDRAAAEASVSSHYPTAPYGPATAVVTVITLDAFDRAQVAAKFAEAIEAVGPWANGDTKVVKLEFPGCVKTVKKETTIDHDAMLAKVHFTGGIHHVFHCEGGAD